MKHFKFWRSMAAMSVAAATASAAPSAHAVDVDAGDYTTLPAGTKLGLLYLQHATRNKLYANGNQVPINAQLDSDVGILRGVWNMEVGGLIMAPQVLLPFGKLKGKNDTAALGSESGVGDVIFALPVWFTKPGGKEHFGVGAYLFLPTGSYDKNKALNLGEHRVKFTPQFGWITPLSDSVTFDLIGDFTLFGKNNDAGAAGQTLKQTPQFQLQSWLRYNFSATTDMRFGLSQVSGGETKLDGVKQDNRQSTLKFSLGGSHFFSPTTQFVAAYGQDIKVKNGFKENGRLNLRLLQIF
jgi:hypothetical protein